MIKELKAGCLVLHGFGSCPEEMTLLTDSLEDKGIITLCPTLSGHGGKRSDIRISSYNEWIKCAEEAYKKLDRCCVNTIIIGFSMGGLIGIQLARKYKPTALITVSTPVYCCDLWELFSQFVKNVVTLRWNPIVQYLKTVLSTPAHTGIEVFKLIRDTKNVMKDVKCPILVLQGKKDVTVKWESAEYIYNNIPCNDKEICFLDKSGHMVFNDCEKQKAISQISAFISREIEHDISKYYLN